MILIYTQYAFGENVILAEKNKNHVALYSPWTAGDPCATEL